MVCFVHSLRNVVAFLSWIMHFQAFASSDASTKGKGEEKRVTVPRVESRRAVSPLGSCADPGSAWNHQHRHCAPVKAQLMVEVPAASFSYVVRSGGTVREGALRNSLA